jgi:glutathione synthase/RimK-type ligase-like ATP-grasp enzyme
LTALIVVENKARWPFRVKGAEVVSAREYLADSHYADLRRARVFNLCRTYAYQTLGYYVSLLASARGHRPMPSVETIQDLRLSPLLRIASQDLDSLIQRSLGPLRSRRFELSVYFGGNMAKRYERLSKALFNQFPAPFLRATFEKTNRWKLQNLRLIATSDIPDSHREFVIQRAEEVFSRAQRPRAPRRSYRYDLALLADPEAEDAPSDEQALRAFARAGRELDIDVVRIDRNDYGRIAEFDALFIRETTYVDHPTYRFARRAAAEGLVVVDDPASIVRCTNKVYQAELFSRLSIPCPPTLVVHEGNVDTVVDSVGLPCVLKQPDSSFSQGVVRVETPEALLEETGRLLKESDLLIAQAFTPSAFDWRVGVLGNRALWVCKYHMARGHWQIIARGADSRSRHGKVESVPVEAAPPEAVELALRCTGAIGDGLYGVDVKQVDGHFLVMEVNDNPNIDAGYEDSVLGFELYRCVMRHFRERLDARGAVSSATAP